MSTATRVWDLPTRLFHWLLVLCVAALYLSGLSGGDALRWHFLAGYLLLSLLLFRLCWGIFGGHWSRFARFGSEAVRVYSYPRPSEHAVGHSAQGWLAVFGLLLLLALQVGTGLVSDDEIATQGPLSHLLSSDLVALATFYHARLGKWLLAGLVALHMSAIIYYRLVHRLNLVGAMISGDKSVADAVPPSRDDAAQRLRALWLWLGCAGAVWLLLLLG